MITSTKLLMPQSFTTNIYCLYLIKLAKWLMLIMPIVALFYNDNGLDHFDIFLLQAVYSLSVALLEIPSGYMADIIGRKKSLVIGSLSAGYTLAIALQVSGLILTVLALFTGFFLFLSLGKEITRSG